MSLADVWNQEMAGAVEFASLGGIVPKTITRLPRLGNPPPRTVETPSGLLNAIGLDNDGIEHFLRHHLPYLRTLPTTILATLPAKRRTTSWPWPSSWAGRKAWPGSS